MLCFIKPAYGWNHRFLKIFVLAISGNWRQIVMIWCPLGQTHHETKHFIPWSSWRRSSQSFAISLIRISSLDIAVLCYFSSCRIYHACYVEFHMLLCVLKLSNSKEFAATRCNVVPPNAETVLLHLVGVSLTACPVRHTVRCLNKF